MFCVWSDEPLCLPVFSEESYNDTSYNATGPHGGELIPVLTAALPVHLLIHVPQYHG